MIPEGQEPPLQTWPDPIKTLEIPPVEESPKEHLKKRRFSPDTINDLLFWGAHLCIVAISLAIVWTKLESNRIIFLKLIEAQNQEIEITKEQKREQKTAIDAIEQDVFKANKEIVDAIEHVKHTVLDTQADMIKRDLDAAQMRKILSAQMNETLKQVTEISQSILTATQDTKTAAQQASVDASQAATAAQKKPVVKTRTIYRNVKKKVELNWFQKLFHTQ